VGESEEDKGAQNTVKNKASGSSNRGQGKKQGQGGDRAESPEALYNS